MFFRNAQSRFSINNMTKGFQHISWLPFQGFCNYKILCKVLPFFLSISSVNKEANRFCLPVSFIFKCKQVWTVQIDSVDVFSPAPYTYQITAVPIFVLQTKGFHVVGFLDFTPPKISIHQNEWWLRPFWRGDVNHGAYHNRLFLIVFGVCGNSVAVYGDADSIMKSLTRGSLLLLGDFALFRRTTRFD